MISFDPQSLLSRYSALAGATFVTAVLGFAVTALLARHFGPAGFGAISLASTLISYALVVANCGTGLYAVRTVAMGQQTLETMVPALIWIRALNGAAVFGLLAICAYTVPQLYESRFLILLFALTLLTNAVLLLWVPQAVHRSNTVAASKVLLQLLNLCLLYLLLQLHSSTLMAPIALILAEIVVAVVVASTIRSYTGALRWWPRPRAMGRILIQSMPIGLTNLVRSFAMASDLIILGLMVAHADLGIYAAGYKLFMFMLALGSAYFLILLPQLAEISASSAQIREELRASFRRVLPSLCIGVAALWLLAEHIIELLFGAGFTGATEVLQALSLVLVVNIISRHYRQVLLVKKMQTLDLKLSMASGIVHLLSKVLLIPVLGIVGCAVGSLLGELLLLAAQRAAAMRLLGDDEEPVA